jgi:cellulose synthase operon protein C
MDESAEMREPGAPIRLDAFNALLTQASSGQSFAEIRRGLVPDRWAPVLAHAAVAGRFDEDIYTRLLSAGSGGQPSLETLASAGMIEPVPGRPGWFAMPEEDRAVWATDLAGPELVELKSKLGEAHLGRGDKLEAMQHLLSSSPAEGRRLLESLFSEADSALNIPRCWDILSAAEASEGSTGADLAEFIASETAYLNGRSMWLIDYYQSAHFLAPDGLLEQAHSFISAGGPRVWEIVGQGGTGKTMQLRWMVSRLWVPPPARTPCARIDFDSVDPMTCARYPFLVFIALADQLAPQLPRNPFSRLLRSYEPFLALAMRGTLQAASLPAAQAARAAEEVPASFADCCRAAGDAPIVIILDTLEELSLRYPMETAAIVSQFRQSVDAAPALRLVFSGRYTIPAVQESFPAARQDTVTPFGNDQADAYLAKIRGITDPVRRAELVRRAGGLPYVLAMYADLVTTNPAALLDDVDEKIEPRLVYLVERIIDRIPEPLVRWLLRYGSVPRRLTRHYVLNVLAPFLIDASSGDRTLDDPMLDPITEWQGRRLFPNDLPGLQAGLDQAWHDLQRYVSGSSWVTRPVGEPDTVVLKTEVLAPLRAVLASRPVLRELHLRSADFYRQQAGNQPMRRSRLLGETIYHLAQAGSADLVKSWHEFIDQAREKGDYAALAELSPEISGPEYVDDEGMPLCRGDAQIVPLPLVVESHLWRAYAAQGLAVRQLQGGLRPGWQDDPLWTEVRHECSEVERVAGLTLQAWADGTAPDRRPLLARAVRLVSAALAFADGNAERAWRITDSLEDAEDDVELCRLALRVAAAPVIGQDPTDLLARLTDRALRAGRPRDASTGAEILAAGRAAIGDLDGATSLVRRVNTQTGLLSDTYLQLLTECGRPAEAVRWIEPPSDSVEDSLAVCWRRAEAYLALRQPEKALRLLRQAEEDLAQLTDTAVQLRGRASCAEMRGMAHGTVLQLDEAAAAFEESASLWLELGHPHGHLRSRRHHAEVLLREAGDVAQTLVLLEGLTPQLDDSDESAAVLRLRAEALGRYGQPEEAAHILEPLMPVGPQGPGTPRSWFQASVAGLVATQDVERFGPLLFEYRWFVRPSTARLRLLQELRWSEPLPRHPLLQTLVDEVMAADGPPPPPEDLAVHELQRAYVARACGDPRLRDRLASSLREAGSSYLACELLRHFPDEAPDSASSLAFDFLSGGPGQTGTLFAMVNLRLAERRLHRGAEPHEVYSLIDIAQREIESSGRSSRWQAEFHMLYALAAQASGESARASNEFQSALALQERLGDEVGVRLNQSQLASVADQTGMTGRGAPLPTGTGELLVQPAGGLGGSVAFGPPGPGDSDLSAMRLSIELAWRSSAQPIPPDPVVRVESLEPAELSRVWEFAADRVYRSQPPAGSVKRDAKWLRWALGILERPLPPEVQGECDRVLEYQAPLAHQVRETVELSLSRADGPRSVVIVRGSQEAERSWMYSQQKSGLNLLHSYRAAGWDAVEVTAAEALEYGLLARRRPDVIHLTARMEVSATLGWFDISEEDVLLRGSQKGYGMNTGIFDTNVIQWLADMDRSSGPSTPPPVVVLDPVAAPTAGGLDDILAARNRFAAAVYLDGIAMAVVATGLADRDPLAAQQAWLDGIGRGDPLEQVVHEVRQRASPGPPPALFAPSSTFTIPRT